MKNIILVTLCAFVAIVLICYKPARRSIYSGGNTKKTKLHKKIINPFKMKKTPNIYYKINY